MLNVRLSRAALTALLLSISCSDSEPETMGTGDPGTPPSTMPTAGSAATPSQSGMPPSSANAGSGSAQPPQGAAGQSMGSDPMTMPENPSVMTMDPTTPFDQLPESCKGFEVLGLTHSPGGSTLPNKCAPFDNVRNNPYAIRCIDADPSYSTGWPGDEWCILPPDPELGIQVGVNPSDYDNPEPGFVLEPGREVTQNYYTNATNPEQHYYYRVNLRLRTGSHHIINSLIADRSDGWTMEQDTGLGQKGFLGAQRPDADRPMTLEVAPENAGQGDVLEANQQFQFNMHHFNFTQTPVLREIWANIWWKPQSEVTDPLSGIGIFGNPLDLSIPAGEHRELHYRCNVTGNTRIVSLNGHRHAHTDRFGVWIVRADGAMESVYESFDYNDMPTFAYDSLSQNPVPDLDQRKDGASSGVLNVGPGDEIHFVCDVNNDSMQALRFANQVQTGEMCILFGSRTGSGLCGSGTRVQ